MADYRRYFVAGGSYFFTVVTHRRRPLFSNAAARSILHDCVEAVKLRHPFSLDSAVLLPDHLHMIWSLPPGDADYSVRWLKIKGEFTRRWIHRGGHELRISDSQRSERRRGIWQRRFFEHTIRDEDEFAAYADYIHYNPVKHGLAKSPLDWPWSSFHRFVRAGHYHNEWGHTTLEFPSIDESLVE